MSIRRNTLWNLIGTGLPFVLGALTIPYLLKKIGVEAFGVLTLVWALIGYFSLFDFGLGRALTQQVASVLSSGQHLRLPGLVKTGLWFTAGTGLLGAIVLATLAHKLSTDWLKISVGLQSSTMLALLIAAIGIPLTTVTTGLRGILEAYENFKVVNLLRMLLGVANFGFPALCVMWINDSLALMVASLVFARLIVFYFHVWLVHRKMPAGWHAATFDKNNLNGLLSFGVWMTISNIVSPLMVTADRFFISAVLGAAVVAYYTVPFEVLIRVLVIPAALTSVLFPRLSAVLVNDQIEARRLYRKCLKVITLTLLPVCILLAILSKWGLTLWLGSEFAEKSWLTVSIMAVGLLLNGIAHVPFAAIQAAGDARKTAYLHLFELVIYIPVLYVGMKLFGLVGVAIAWTIRVAIDLLVLLVYAKNKNL